MGIREGYKELFVKNTLFGVAQQLISIVTTFFLLPYMIWRMGAENYGLWMILKIFSIGGYFSLAGMGFQDSIVRYLTKFYVEENAERFKKLYLSSLILFFVIGVLCSIIVLFFNKYLFLRVFKIQNTYAAQMQLCLAVYAFSFLFQFPALVLKAYYTSIQDFSKLRLWETLNVVLLFFLIVVVMFFTSSILSVVFIETLISFILFMIFLFTPFKYYREYYDLNINYFSLNSLKNASGMTYYLFFNRIFGIGYNRMPQIVIAYFLTPSYVTYYSIINKIPRTLKLLQGMINSAVLPLAVSLDTLHYHDKMKNLFLRGTRYSFLFLTPIVVFMFICAKDILKLWMGVDYAFLANYMRVYVLWQYLTFFVSFGSSMYTQKEHFKYLLPYRILANVVFLLAMMVFIKKLELWSILIGLLLSGLITIYVNMNLIHKINRFSFYAFFNYVLKIPIIFGVLFCVAMLLFLKVYVPFNNILLIVTYAGIMYLSYLVFVYRYGLFDFERNDINSLLQKL